MSDDGRPTIAPQAPPELTSKSRRKPRKRELPDPFKMSDSARQS